MAGELKINFEPKRLDYIYNVLAQRPWAEVQDIIADLQRQVAHQQNPGFFPAPVVAEEVPKDEAA